MNDYRPDVPRAASAVAATALMTLAIATLVVIPATLDSRPEPPLTLAAPAKAPIEAAIAPARIDVIGVRTPVSRGRWGTARSRASRRCNYFTPPRGNATAIS